jgi:hypothetical protein
MKFGRDDYTLQNLSLADLLGKIPDNEPVFLLRAQDLAAPDTVREWCRLAHKNGASVETLMSAYKQASAMEEWQRKNARKTPDVPPTKA